jgi:uncharacterized protein (DUF2141 family)
MCWLAIIIFSFSLSNSISGGNGNLKVVVSHIRNNTGQIGFCLFNSSKGFPNHPDKALVSIFIKAIANSTNYTFSNVSTGSYAICVFHDENSDRKVNTNIIGIPKEGIGVSNNAKGSFGPPKFDDAKFVFKGPEQTIRVSLSYF